MRACVHVCVCVCERSRARVHACSECQIMVDEALTRLRSAEERHDLKDHQFRFLRALLSSAVLKDNDITTLVLSLMTDGLPSVRSEWMGTY